MSDLRPEKRVSAPLRLALALAIMLAPLAAEAYVGPGAGLSLLGALWGLLCAIGAALLFVIMWPIRRMRRRKREAKQADANAPNAAKGANPPDNKGAREDRRPPD